MANNISPSTGQPYYSGDWEQDIKHLIKSTNVGEGIMNTVNMTEITKYQEQVDRLIDAQLQALYKTPFKQLKVNTNISHNSFLPSKVGLIDRI